MVKCSDMFEYICSRITKKDHERHRVDLLARWDESIFNTR